jgi:hypothetical protein
MTGRPTSGDRNHLRDRRTTITRTGSVGDHDSPSGSASTSPQGRVRSSRAGRLPCAPTLGRFERGSFPRYRFKGGHGSVLTSRMRYSTTAYPSARGFGRSLLMLPQHPDEHRSERPVLLAVDQELGEGPALREAPELSDTVGAVEVGEHEDVEQFGAWRASQSVDSTCLPSTSCSSGAL